MHLVLEVLVAAAELHGLALLHASGVVVKRHHAHPGLVSVSAGDHAAVCEGPDSHQVVLASGHDVLPVRAPADAEKSAEVTLHGAVELHRIEVEDAQESVLTHAGQEFSVGREGELVERALAHRPLQQRVARGLALAGVNGVALALLQQLVVRRRGAAGVLHVIQEQAPAGVGHEEQALGARDPLHTRDPRLIDQSLSGSGENKTENTWVS